MANLNKYRDQRDRPDLSAPESLQLYQDTRFDQLKVATELGLWQVCVLFPLAPYCVSSKSGWFLMYLFFSRKLSVLWKTYMD